MSARISAAIGYIRVSSDDQADSGLSLTSQRLRIEAYAVAQGWTLLEIIQDVKSAKNMDRPGLRRALASIAPGRALVVLKLDRLVRRVPDLYAITTIIEERGGALASVHEHIDTSTATGRLMRNLIVEIAEWERGIIGERTKAAMSVLKSEGRHVGRTPYGYRPGPDGRLVPEPDQQAHIAAMRHDRRIGRTWHEIARRHTERTGSSICHTTARRIVMHADSIDKRPA